MGSESYLHRGIGDTCKKAQKKPYEFVASPH
jgi:hypothetical protein